MSSQITLLMTRIDRTPPSVSLVTMFAIEQSVQKKMSLEVSERCCKNWWVATAALPKMIDSDYRKSTSKLD